MAATTDVAHAGAHGHDKPHHDYHLVNPSPWPFVGSLSALVLVLGGVMYLHEVAAGPIVLLLGLAGVITTMVGWWRDVVAESRHGEHTDIVAKGLRLGMVLFITSEVFFFVAFFWAFFWGALVPPETVAQTWPPEGVPPLPTWDIPFLNTLILLLSGTTVTWAHHAIRQGDQPTAAKALLITVVLGLIFTGFQVYEYVHLVHEGMNITTGIYGSTFYMATGFHGFHVLVGTTFLFVCLMRAWYGHFKPNKHVGFEAAAWYWHFVDVVWLFLFVCVYWWGGGLKWATTGLG